MSTRTYGLSGSGMDIDQMVKDMMKARRVSYDKVWQKKAQTEWMKKDYNTIYSLAQEFRNSTIFDFRKSSSFLPKQVSLSKDAVLTATANADAANVSHSVVVEQLADGVKLSSSASILGNGTLVDKFGYTSGSSLEFTINNKPISVNITTATTLNDVAKAINDSGAGVKANYDATLDRFYLYSSKTGSGAAINFAGSSSAGLTFLNDKLKLSEQNNTVTPAGLISEGNLGISDAQFTTEELGTKFSFSSPININVTKGSTTSTITINPTNKLSDVLGAINTTVGAPPVASYNATTGKVTLKATGSNFSISGADATGTDFLTNKLQLGRIGQDSKINLDGVELTQASNSFTISGVSYNLNSVSPMDTNGLPISTNLNIQADVEKTIANVKTFVDSYNKFISAVNTELNETKYKDYMPLTEAQKGNMKDSEITAWEEKAQSGLLHNDSILSDMVTNLRSSFSASVSGLTGDYTSASSIGITTDSYINEDGKFVSDYSNSGKLNVNEDKLRKALTEDPDIISKIFGSTGDTEQNKGIATRLYDKMNTSLNKIKDQAGYPGFTDISSSLAKRLTNYEDQLTTMNSRLADIEDRYYKQFDAMETALSKLNKQSSWLTQQFSTNSNN